MKKSILSLAVATTLFSGVANADFLGVEVGAGMWMPKTTGDFKYSGTTMDLEDNLGYGDDESSTYTYIQFEHPVPVIPNVKLIQTNLEMDATKVNTVDVTFAGQTYSASNTISTSLTLNQTDYILYYEFSEGLIIPFVHLDGGIAIKNLQGEIALSSTVTGAHSKSFDAPVPMLYGKIKISTSAIPFIPVDIEYETMQLSVGDNKFSDTRYGIVYDVELAAGFNIGAVAGIRKEVLEIDASSVTANIDISGYYFGAYFNW